MPSRVLRQLVTEFGYVYFIVGDERVKIGVTVNLQLRLDELQCGSPIALDLVAYIPTENPFELEHELHDQFKHFRSHGEWFDYTRSIRDWLRSKVNRNRVNYNIISTGSNKQYEIVAHNRPEVKRKRG